MSQYLNTPVYHKIQSKELQSYASYAATYVGLGYVRAMILTKSPKKLFIMVDICEKVYVYKLLRFQYIMQSFKFYGLRHWQSGLWLAIIGV
jgi:hypothetical protein